MSDIDLSPHQVREINRLLMQHGGVGVVKLSDHQDIFGVLRVEIVSGRKGYHGSYLIAKSGDLITEDDLPR